MRTKAAAVQGAAGAGLGVLFRARSIALVGAAERSMWSQAAFANFERIGFAGCVHLVSRKWGVMHGSPTATSCAMIGEPVDAALLMVPEQAIAEAFADMNAAGIRNAVVLTSGFAEVGAEGLRRQEGLLTAARASTGARRPGRWRASATPRWRPARRSSRWR